MKAEAREDGDTGEIRDGVACVPASRLPAEPTVLDNALAPAGDSASLRSLAKESILAVFRMEALMGVLGSLAVLEEGEEKDPQQAHGVPVPDGGVNDDLAGGELA